MVVAAVAAVAVIVSPFGNTTSVCTQPPPHFGARANALPGLHLGGNVWVQHGEADLEILVTGQVVEIERPDRVVHAVHGHRLGGPIKEIASGREQDGPLSQRNRQRKRQPMAQQAITRAR